MHELNGCSVTKNAQRTVQMSHSNTRRQVILSRVTRQSFKFGHIHHPMDQWSEHRSIPFIFFVCWCSLCQLANSIELHVRSTHVWTFGWKPKWPPWSPSRSEGVDEDKAGTWWPGTQDRAFFQPQAHEYAPQKSRSQCQRYVKLMLWKIGVLLTIWLLRWSKICIQ